MFARTAASEDVRIAQSGQLKIFSSTKPSLLKQHPRSPNRCTTTYFDLLPDNDYQEYTESPRTQKKCRRGQRNYFDLDLDLDLDLCLDLELGSI